MKNAIKFIAFAFIALAFTACGDDDAPRKELTNDELAGTYEMTFLEGRFEETTLFNGVEITSITTLEGDTFEVVAFFNADGTFTLDGDYRLTTETRVNGQSPITNSSIESFSESDSYILNDEERTILFLDGTEFEVTRFTDSELRLESDETTIDGDETERAQAELRFRRTTEIQS